MLESLHPNYIALISAVFTATAQTLLGKSIGRLSPGMVALIANIVITIVATIFYFLGSGVDEWPLYAVILFAISGVTANFAARYLMYLAIQLIGLSRTQVLFQFSPLWSALVAISFLGERPTLEVGAGTLLIVGGAILIMGERKKADSNVKFIYYLLPILAAFVMATAPSMRKHAFTFIPSATFGLAVACFVASFLQAAIMPITERKTEYKMKFGPVLLCIVGGVMNAAAAMTFWVSLRLGEVIEVVPIRRVSVLLVVLFSWLFMGKQDTITWRVVIGAIITLSGGMAILWAG
ncbi:MAG: DMT family transporter [Nitrospinaceae bacterium]|nr:DMT family transporter [Nitrospinaceae bacterium]MBT3433365.1 DMT family transporter [Nitrospinaceae bacterium]MBT3820656.1 DMT family transporter [Nitrospinaceae bacterium]MBT4094569.1 DMT family transporter [Nitrospinaceae bacterium]MBT4432023.1 DMT family transporter [Nitrospinaceae bacterium]